MSEETFIQNGLSYIYKVYLHLPTRESEGTFTFILYSSWSHSSNIFPGSKNYITGLFCESYYWVFHVQILWCNWYFCKTKKWTNLHSFLGAASLYYHNLTTFWDSNKFTALSNNTQKRSMADTTADVHKTIHPIQ